MKLLAIMGSPRPNGNTNFLVDQTLAAAAELGAEVEKVNLSEVNIKPCQGHDACGSFPACVQRDDTAGILAKLLQADGVILATPVYYYDVSAQLKAFIDRNYFLYMHDLKPVARAAGIIIVAGSEGIEDTLRTIKKYIASSFNIDSRRIFTVSGYAGAAGSVRSNAPLINEAQKLGKKMVESLKGS